MKPSTQSLWLLITCLFGGNLLAEGRVETRSFPSNALGREVPFSAWIPNSAPPEGGWPLVMVLHGAGRNHRTLLEAEATRHALSTRGLVLVFADGKLGWWIDSQAEPASKYSSMLLELLAHARRELPVSSAPSQTGVCGWSMGGYGSVRFAESHPQEVGAVATAIGLLDFPNPALPREQNYRMPSVFGSDAMAWPQMNCMAHAERLRGHHLLFIAARKAFDYQMNLHFHQRLLSLQIEHELREMEGGHTFPVVEAAWPQMLDFMEVHLRSSHKPP